jgi:nuclear pore complex protein Nup107
MSASPLLTELVVVREWLQESSPLPQKPEATTGYWKFTKHGVMQSLRLGRSTALVGELDPDAPSREEAKMLAAEDAVRTTFSP